MSSTSRKARALALTLLLLSALSACHLLDDFNFLGSHLVGIGVSGDTVVAVGDTIHLKAAGSLDGLIGLLAYDPLRDARWSVSPPGIATIARPPASPEDSLASSAIITGREPGRVVIEASARGITGTHVVLVVRMAPLPSPTR
jgi:hypothetical protein